MDIFLTFDYEIFFGDVSGSVDKCMVEPTEALLEIGELHKVQFTFFWDIGHYLALERYEKHFPQLKIDKLKIEKQLHKALSLGHDVQLHIHPHWEMAEYKDGKWKMNLESHYKLSDFSIEERQSIFKRYNEAMNRFRGKASVAFRAGGWCIQPFTDFERLFKTHNIRFDSSVMPGVKWISDQYKLDFTRQKSSEPYRFSSDECSPDMDGDFTEYPIATKYYSPFFFWKLYVLGRLFPSQHKMIGDGNFVAQPGSKKEMLTKGKLHHASSDGYFASELLNILKEKNERKASTLVIIGHPKSQTRFSLKELEKFIRKNKNHHQFQTFQNVP